MIPYTYSFMSPPCQNGHHVFIHQTSYFSSEPPEGTPCACGQVYWIKSEPLLGFDNIKTCPKCGYLNVGHKVCTHCWGLLDD